MLANPALNTFNTFMSQARLLSGVVGVKWRKRLDAAHGKWDHGKGG